MTRPQWCVSPAPLFTTVYVDSVTGSDDNIGSLSTAPLKTLGVAASRLAGRVGTIKVTAPLTAPLREWYRHLTAFGLTIESATPGVPWYNFGSDRVTSGWASLGGGVWSRTVTGVPSTITHLVVATLTETIGDLSDWWLRMPKTTGTQTTPTVGRFGLVGTTVYVRLPGDADPNTHTIEVPIRTHGLSSEGASTLTVVDGNCWIGRLSGHRLGVAGSTSARYVAIDCGARYAGDSGFMADAVYDEFVLTGCESLANGNDGYNHHGTAGETGLMTLTNCVGSYNIDEGHSPHDDTTMLVVGGEYAYNGSGGGTAVLQAVMTVTGGAEYHHNQATTLTAGEGAVCWRDATTSGALTGGTQIHDNFGPGVIIKAGATVTLGSYTSSGNGAPDNLAYP